MPGPVHNYSCSQVGKALGSLLLGPNPICTNFKDLAWQLFHETFSDLPNVNYFITTSFLSIRPIFYSYGDILSDHMVLENKLCIQFCKYIFFTSQYHEQGENNQALWTFKGHRNPSGYKL